MDSTVTETLTGRLIDGRYLVDALVARGGMAAVYTALDTRLDRSVALKVMRPELAADPDFVVRFHREAKASARIDHPNVVAVTDQGSDAGLVFLVMEYVAGRTLRDVLSQRGRLKPLEALDVLEPVLLALGAAHAAGVVHRDIKPENVLLGDDGRVKVTDFGLARAVGTTAATTGIVLGTAAYLAPEQVSGSGGDARSDVYATGVMLFELVTGTQPHSGDSPLSVAYQHVNTDVPAPSSVVPALPSVIDDLVARATQRSADERYPDAPAFLADLRRARQVVAMSLSGTNATIALPAASPRESEARTTVMPQHTSVMPLAPATDAVPLATSTDDSGDEPGLPAERGRKHRHWRPRIVLPLVLAFLLAGGVGWWLGAGRYTATPKLIGLTQAAAAAEARQHHLLVRIDPAAVYSESVPEGLVASQSPSPGNHVRRGGTVVLHLSRGPQLFAVPAVIGLKEAAARAALTGARLGVGTTQLAFDDSVAAGNVISVSPSVGTRLRSHTVVTLTVSRGPQPTALPDVTGDKQGDAVQTLSDLGFQVQVTQAFDNDIPAGRVIRQTPTGGAGVMAPHGSTVTLTVSKGPQTVQVPDVRGRSSAEARQMLLDVGLVPNLILIDGSQDVVVSTDPQHGKRVRTGTTVDVYVI